MAYYHVRLTTNTGDLPIDELVRLIVKEQLVPKLTDAGGLQRYVFGVTDDGRLVSASIYDTKASADRGLERSIQVVAQLTPGKSYKLQQSFGGEIVRDDGGPAQGHFSTHGVGRIMNTSVPAEDVAYILYEHRSEEMAKFQGRVRTLIVQLDDGRVLTTSAFSSREARNRWLRLTRDHISGNPILKELYKDAEEIKMTIHFHQ